MPGGLVLGIPEKRKINLETEGYVCVYKPKGSWERSSLGYELGGAGGQGVAAGGEGWLYKTHSDKDKNNCSLAPETTFSSFKIAESSTEKRQETFSADSSLK